MARLNSIARFPFTWWVALIVVLPVLIFTIPHTGDSEYADPVAIPVELSANFGEIREGHWHMGIDIRTKGRENIPVQAVAEGYISRIGISADGYGKVMYITHKNNRTSLYAHLSLFQPQLESVLRARQQQTESWEQDIIIAPGTYPVNKGERVAWSGNSGHSEGPHLHFEWRNTTTGLCLNPQLELMKLKDDLPPVLEAIYWYNGMQPGLQSAPAAIPLPAISAAPVIVGSPQIMFGISAVDKISGSRFNMGVYQVRLLFDDSLVYHIEMESVPVTGSRYSDYYIDYASWCRDERVIQLLRQPALPAAGSLEGGYVANSSGRGVISLIDQELHRVRLELTDINGNHASYEFRLRYSPANKWIVSRGNVQAHTLPGSLHTDNIIIQPIGATAEQLRKIRVEELIPATTDPLFPSVSINDGTLLPVDSIHIRLRALKVPFAEEKSKLVLVVNNKTGGKVTAGRWINGWFAAGTREAGVVSVICDTSSPQILLRGWKNRQRFRHGDILKIVVEDNLHTISSFRAELNGRWVAFNKKNNHYSLIIDDRISAGQHSLMIRAADVAGNITRNVFRFEY